MRPVHIRYALFAGKEISSVENRFARACDGKIALLSAADNGDRAGVMLETLSTDDFPVPTMEVLAQFGRGFDEQSAAALVDSATAIVMTAVGPFDPQQTLLRDFTLCVGRLAKELDAFVFDTADWLTFTPAAFHQLRCAEVEAGQFSAAQFGVRAYRVDGGIRSVSMGLEKFGQPNFALAVFAEHHMSMMDRLMTLAMQHMIEADHRVGPGPLAVSIDGIRNPRLRKELAASQSAGAAGKATLHLEALAPLQGDPLILLAPVFQASAGPPLWEGQARLLTQVFGTDRHVSKNVNFGDAIQEAIEKARGRAVEILSTPCTWQQEGRRLRLAVGLPKVKEVVWLEVTSWKNGKGAGILLSQPQSTRHLNSGDTVTFTPDAIMDFTLTNPEGLIESGGVDEMVRRLQGG